MPLRATFLTSLIPVVVTLALLAGCASTGGFPVRRTPALWSSSSSPYPSLKTAIDTLLADTLFPPSNVGIKVVSLTRHETLYQLNARMLFNPASNGKLFTAAAALSLLGEKFPLPTIALADTATHTLYLKGSGDPLLSTADLDSLSREVRRRSPAGKKWRLVADISAFDDLWWGPGWAWDDEPDPTAMFVTPLCLNGNAIRVRVTPGRKAGEPARISTDPPTAYVSILDSAVTVDDTSSATQIQPVRIMRDWRGRSNVITVRGQIAANGPGTSTRLSVWEPEMYAAAVFAEQLRKQGLNIASTSVDTAGPSAFPVARIVHTLDTVLTYMNKESDNLSAESLLKVLAAARGSMPGTTAAGARIVKEYLFSIGIDTARMEFVDGSGLSRYNLATPDALVRVLQTVHDGDHFPLFSASLPIAGVDGTLSRRMRGTQAEGNVRAKTGTETGFSTLSGYVRTKGDELLAFSIMMQSYPGESRAYRLVQDRIAAFLSSLSRPGR